jgi:hypothetical protein
VSRADKAKPLWHFNADPSRAARFLSAQNRMFMHVGYDNVEWLDPAPEWQAGSTL